MTRRNGTLDALRALAIILVVNCHAAATFAPPGPWKALQLGGKGVDLFFLLSGWLLGHQLLVELRETRTIDLRRFWYRRWLRTLPAYYAVLAMTIFWQVASHHSLRFSWPYLVFGQTYLTDLPYFGVSWSLCVEEHFYLAVAPLLLLAFRTRRGALLLVPLLLAPAVCRQLGWYRSLEQTHVRWDQCATGVALAYPAVFLPVVWQRLCRAAPELAVAGLALIGWNIVIRLNPGLGLTDHGPLTWALIFASFVLLANSGDRWSRNFRLPGSRFLADRAYSIYLLHVEALVIVRRLGHGNLSFAAALALTWVVSLILAEGLHRAVERPFMRAREGFAASRSRPETLAPEGTRPDPPCPRLVSEGALAGQGAPS